TFYQGILQIAVALYHLGNENVRGAAILLGEGSNRLRRYPSIYGGVDVDKLLDQSTALLSIVQQLSLEQVGSLDLSTNTTLPIPKIILSQ
nr:DUF309 domain-containing protein [Calothrix sp. MO_167.B42]